LIEPQNQGQLFVSGFVVVWPQNHCDGFSRFDLKTGGDGFSRFGLKTDGYGFPDLGLKTDSCSLVIYSSKSPRWFFGFGLKTKRASVCRLRHKTNGGWSAQHMPRDLATCFVRKLVGLKFPSLAKRLVKA
jgi:hypothetical protein